MHISLEDLENEPALFPLSLPGDYQLMNAPAVAAALRLLLPAESEAKAFAGMGLARHPGRFDLRLLTLPSQRVLRILIDGAHNPDGVRAFASSLSALNGVRSAKTWDQAFPRTGLHTTAALPENAPSAVESASKSQQRVVIFAVSGSRDPLTLLPLLVGMVPESATEPTGVISAQQIPFRWVVDEDRRSVVVICTRFSPPAGMAWVKSKDPLDLANAALACGIPEQNVAVAADLLAALEMAADAGALASNVRIANEGPGNVSVNAIMCGSLYLVGELERLITRKLLE
jgi:hypothetical protein